MLLSLRLSGGKSYSRYRVKDTGEFNTEENHKQNRVVFIVSEDTDKAQYFLEVAEKFPNINKDMAHISFTNVCRIYANSPKVSTVIMNANINTDDNFVKNIKRRQNNYDCTQLDHNT